MAQGQDRTLLGAEFARALAVKDFGRIRELLPPRSTSAG